jgi:hypothetical protein
VSDLSNGEYLVRWEVRQTPVGMPENVAQDSRIIEGLEPVATPTPAPAVPTVAELHGVTHERDQLRKVLEETQVDRERIRSLLGNAEQAFLTCKFALAAASLVRATG